MPKGVYVRTEQARKNISKASKGRKNPVGGNYEMLCL